jgi:hypothetical protein
MNLRIRTPIRRGVVLLVLLSALTITAGAHDFSTSYARIDVTGSSVDVRFTMNRRDLLVPNLAEAVTTNYKLDAPEPPLTVAVQQQDSIADNVEVLELVYTFSHTVKKLHIVSTLDRVTQAGHSHILQIGEGDDARQAILNASSPSVEIDLEDKTFLATVWGFVKLGIEHIFTGYDHLAFLAGLLIMTTSAKGLFKVVTSFTAAHSITLALATFGLVSVPSRLIESLIALSIAYIAIENFTGKTLVHRWKITFLFGLIHGFGFSNVLKEMVLTRRTLAISLFSFNGGVELGQLAFVSLVFPLVLYLTGSRWKGRFLTASSLSIAALGFFWFIQRAFWQ